MRTFEKQAAQGDFLITKIDELPEGLEAEKPEAGQHIIAHSETGHNHTMRANDVQLFNEPSNPFVCYLMVDRAGTIEHQRSFDTHEAILVNPGIYRINRQREYTPEGYRRAAD